MLICWLCPRGGWGGLLYIRGRGCYQFFLGIEINVLVPFRTVISRIATLWNFWFLLGSGKLELYNKYVNLSNNIFNWSLLGVNFIDATPTTLVPYRGHFQSSVRAPLPFNIRSPLPPWGLRLFKSSTASILSFLSATTLVVMLMAIIEAYGTPTIISDVTSY